MLQLIHIIGHYFFVHYHALKLSIKNLVSAPLNSILIISTIALSLSLPIISLMTLSNIKTLTQSWDMGGITLYLQKNTTSAQAQSLLAMLLKKKDIQSGTYLPPEVQLKNFQDWSHLEETVALLPDNPFPGVIILYPKTTYQSPAMLKQLMLLLKQLNEVDHISFDQEGMIKLNAVLQLAETLFFIVMGVIGLGLILTIANTVRLALAKHKEELATLSLIGAAPAFIRRPFLYRGLWYGLLGALLSYALVILIMQPIDPLLHRIATLYGHPFSASLGDLNTFIMTVSIGTTLGLLGAWLALFLYFKKFV